MYFHPLPYPSSPFRYTTPDNPPPPFHPVVCIFFSFIYTYIYKISLAKTKPQQLGFPALPENPPTVEELEADEKTLKDLHSLLMETQIMEGKLVCGCCGHEYAVREGIANFLLPSHLV